MTSQRPGHVCGQTETLAWSASASEASEAPVPRRDASSCYSHPSHPVGSFSCGFIELSFMLMKRTLERRNFQAVRYVYEIFLSSCFKLPQINSGLGVWGNHIGPSGPIRIRKTLVKCEFQEPGTILVEKILLHDPASLSTADGLAHSFPIAEALFAL